MNLLFGFGVTLVASGLAIGAILLVRRRAPAGGFFNDGDRAAGVFGVLATGFSILLGFIIFLAFTSYDASRVGAEDEAVTVAQQVETAQLFEPPIASELTNELVCYSRYVAGPEWKQMESGSLSSEINPWGVALFRSLQDIEPDGPVEEAAYGKWLDQTETASRHDRIGSTARSV